MNGLIYAVGDVHGCYELVRRAVDKIRRHARGRDFAVVFLGDYVDRGLHTRETIDYLIDISGAFPMVCLRGNHEEMLLRCVDAPSEDAFQFWRTHGGQATLGSYGLPLNEPLACQRIPPNHLQWIRGRPIVYEDVAHVFVHAGLRPRRPLIEQEPRDLLWIRERFLRSAPADIFEWRHIVHGHTVQWEGKPDAAIPELLPHRTNLDTGAYGTGVLTVGVFVWGRASGPVDLLSVL